MAETPGELPFLAQALAEEAAVAEAGEGVGAGELFEAAVGFVEALLGFAEALFKGREAGGLVEWSGEDLSMTERRAQRDPSGTGEMGALSRFSMVLRAGLGCPKKIVECV